MLKAKYQNFYIPLFQNNWTTGWKNHLTMSCFMRNISFLGHIRAKKCKWLTRIEFISNHNRGNWYRSQ